MRSILLPEVSWIARRERTASAITSTPIPSPGTTAMRRPLMPGPLVGEGRHDPSEDDRGSDEGSEGEEAEAHLLLEALPLERREDEGHQGREDDEDQEVAL